MAPKPVYRLWITEHNNYGDPSFGNLVEPSTRVQEVKVGEISEPLDSNTRVVALYCEVKCRVCFFAPGEEPRLEDATPMSDHYEIERTVHMGAGLRIKVYPL